MPVLEGVRLVGREATEREKMSWEELLQQRLLLE